MTVKRFPLELILPVSGLPSSIDAQPAADFYKNRPMRLIVGHAVGNDYDIGARLLAKYLQKHIPGQPTIAG
jgi:tripartite-type tricarboxylate transporter receptor subunit TctC